jgi:hypothetical protein
MPLRTPAVNVTPAGSVPLWLMVGARRSRRRHGERSRRIQRECGAARARDLRCDRRRCRIGLAGGVAAVSGPGAVASTAINAKIVLPAATVIPVCVKPASLVLPLACVLMDVGAMAPVLNVTALPVKVFPALSLAVALTVYAAGGSDDHTGRVTLSVHVVAVPDVVALFVVARLNTVACQALWHAFHTAVAHHSSRSRRSLAAA